MVDIHIVPLNDEHPHILLEACECLPKVITEFQGEELPEPQCVHNSYDHREFSEQITGEGLSKDKQWATFLLSQQ